MSEVGKIFDRILDYKIRENYNKWSELGEALVNNFLDSIKEQRGLYDFNVCCDKPNEYHGRLNECYVESIEFKPITITELDCVITKDGVSFTEKVKEALNNHYKCIVMENSGKNDLLSYNSDLDARVSENDITLEYNENNQSAIKMFKNWQDYTGS